MLVVVAVVSVGALLAVVAVWAARRRGSDEVHSIQGYRHTLDTLEDIRSRSATGSVRLRHGSPDPEGAAEPGGLGTLDSPAGPGGPEGPDQVAAIRDRRASQRGRQRAISAMNHGPRRVAGPAFMIVVVLAVLAGLVAYGVHESRRGPTGTSLSGATTSTSSGSSPGTTGGSPVTTTGKGGSAAGGTTTTTTSATAPGPFTAVTSSTTAATYAPPASYTLTLAATTGACWVDVKSSSGKTLLTGTLTAGTSRSVTVTGSATVVIGSTAISVNVDHEPVVLPTGFHTPFTMTFSPAGG